VSDEPQSLLHIAAAAAVLVGIIAYQLVVERFWSRAEDVRVLKEIDQLGFIDLEVVADAKGRKRVAIWYWVGNDFTARALLTSDQAFRLARMLRVAAAPGRNLAMARLAWFRARRAAEAAAPSIVIGDEEAK